MLSYICDSPIINSLNPLAHAKSVKVIDYYKRFKPYFQSAGLNNFSWTFPLFCEKLELITLPQDILNNMKKFIYIYLTWLKSLFHKVIANLGKELVVATCTAVLLGLFFYMFTDFINSQLATIPLETQNRVAAIFSYIIVSIAAIMTIKNVRLENSDAHFSFTGWLIRIGESPNSVRAFKLFRGISISSIYHLIAIYILNRYLNYTLNETFYAFTATSFTFSTATGLLLKVSTRKRETLRNVIPSGKLAWRLNIIFKRNNYSKNLIRLATLFSILFLSKIVVLSPLYSWSIFFLIGLFSSFAVYIHLADEIASSWIEKNAGMSHANFIKLTLFTSSIVGIYTSLTAAFIYVCSHYLFDLNINLPLLIQFIFTSMVPVLVVPNVILQIDARRATVNIMSGFLISLFICTAVLAHVASILIIPLLFYYGQSTQVDRYYRA